MNRVVVRCRLKSKAVFMANWLNDFLVGNGKFLGIPEEVGPAGRRIRDFIQQLVRSIELE